MPGSAENTPAPRPPAELAVETDQGTARGHQRTRAVRTLRHFALKLASSVGIVLSVVIVMFILVHVAPGDPVQALVGQVPVTAAFRHSVEAQYGLNHPLGSQLVSYLRNVVTGNLGYSYLNHQSVLPLITAAFLNTLIITVPSMIIASALAVLLGAVAGATRSKLLDRLIMALSLGGFSIPSFWLGMILIWLFAVILGWLPAQGMNASGVGGVAFSHAILPCVCLILPEMCFMLRIMRASVIETLGQDYIDTARAKGLTRPAIVRKHVILNSSLPMVSVIGYSVIYLITGVILVEVVFSWPGVGLLLYQSVQDSNHLVVVGIMLFVTVVVVIANLLTDAVYTLIDPRLRHRAEA